MFHCYQRMPLIFHFMVFDTSVSAKSQILPQLPAIQPLPVFLQQVSIDTASICLTKTESWQHTKTIWDNSISEGVSPIPLSIKAEIMVQRVRSESISDLPQK